MDQLENLGVSDFLGYIVEETEFLEHRLSEGVSGACGLNIRLYLLLYLPQPSKIDLILNSLVALKFIFDICELVKSLEAKFVMLRVLLLELGGEPVVALSEGVDFVFPLLDHADSFLDTVKFLGEFTFETGLMF